MSTPTKSIHDLFEAADRAISKNILPEIESGRVFLTGTPWGDRANIAPLTPESREHIDVREYTARWWHPQKPVVHGVDRGMPIYDFPCSCGRTIRGTDRDRGKRCTHELEAIREAAMAPIPQSMLPTWLQDEALSKPPMRCPRCNSCLFYAEQKHNDRHGKECVQPPTLREWLGDRVADLGRWATVLREQPVPAGDVTAWEWRRGALYALRGEWEPVTAAQVAASVGPFKDCFGAMADVMQAALFTRHPHVVRKRGHMSDRCIKCGQRYGYCLCPKNPKPDAFPWDPYPEVV